MKTMTKRILSILLASLLLIGLMACSKDVDDGALAQTDGTTDTTAPADTEPTAPPTDDDGAGDENGDGNGNGNGDENGNGNGNEDDGQPVPKYTVYLNPDTEGVSLLGVRGAQQNEGISCEWAGSGFELNVNLPKTGDISFMLNSTGACFRVYVDGVPHNNTDGTPYYRTDINVLAFYAKQIAAGDHLISVVRCDDASEGIAIFNKVVIEGTHVTTLPEKDLYIEFVGDEITLGKGLNGTANGYDAMLGFAYKTATALNAEYSITALPEQGVTAGDYSFDTSYELASPKHQPTVRYNFAKQADIVVVALGAHDVQTDDFQTNYFDLIYNIRQKNGADCKIYCVYVGNAGISADIQAACESIGGEAAGFYAVEWTGITGTSYPTAQQQADFATALTTRINATKNDELTRQPERNGIGVIIKWNDGESNA